MKNKKVFIVFIIILAIGAIAFGIFKASHHENYLYNQDGTISDGHADLIEHLKNVEDPIKRRNQVDFSLEQNLITQEEANGLY